MYAHAFRQTDADVVRENFDNVNCADIRLVFREPSIRTDDVELRGRWNRILFGNVTI